MKNHFTPEFIVQYRPKYSEISDAERQSIENGLAEADRGELIPHEAVMKEVKAKYKLD